MTEIIICGLSMEMENAREMGYIGKCRGCLYNDRLYDDGKVWCAKSLRKMQQQENCKEWVVDHR